jgi:hypothetical protein
VENIVKGHKTTFEPGTLFCFPCGMDLSLVVVVVDVETELIFFLGSHLRGPIDGGCDHYRKTPSHTDDRLGIAL